MSSKHEPLRKKEREELAGYIGWVPVAIRLGLFVIVIGGIALLARSLFGGAGSSNPPLANPLWWIVPAVLIGVAILVLAHRWTGGRDFRDRIRRDLEKGDASVHKVHVLEAILIEEEEDEGPLVFVQTELSGVIRFSGQYLARLVDKGFPWAEIVIREAPQSRVFFGVWGDEDTSVPVLRRGPLTRMEAATLGPFDEEYLRLRMDFETLKRTLGVRAGE